jgi:PPM family protein phosphatase
MIRTEHAHLKIIADSHPGMKGKNNEDSYAVSAYRLSEKDSTPVLLAVISDGIGGHRAGEVASGIAVDVISKKVAASDGTQIPYILKDAIEQASNKIYEESLGQPERKGMGGTCAIVCVVGDKLYATNIGDSRIHLIRGGVIQQISTDHTWIQEALDSGLLKPEQVEGHPNAHVIRRYLGGATPPKIDLRLKLTGRETDEQAEANQGTPLRSGDKLLLCSDGLTDLVKPQEMLATLAAQPPEKAIKTLINLANQRGGHDNITIIIIDVLEGALAAAAAAVAKPFPWQWAAVGCLGALIIASGMVIAALAMGLFSLDFLRKSSPTPTPTATLPPPTLTQTFTQTATVTLTETEQPSATPTPTLTETPTSTETITQTPAETSSVPAQTLPSQTPTETATKDKTQGTNSADTPIPTTNPGQTNTFTPAVKTSLPTKSRTPIFKSPTPKKTSDTPWLKTWTPRP